MPKEHKPRFKQKKTPQAPKIVNFDLPDAARMSKGIPDPVKIAIANAIMAFSEMEMSAETVIWDLTGVSIDDGKFLTTSIGAGDKLAILKKLSERYGIPVHKHPQTTKDIWFTIRQLVEARNKVAHGAWMMLDKVFPLVVSYRIPTTQGRIMGEHFPLDRLEAMARSAWKIKEQFDAMARHINSLPKRPEPVPEPPTEYPEFPTEE
jgi:hypothetical protein